ncbi:MAG: c-type cytochrome [Candidatus Methylomirabilia bacterium]
MPRIALLVLVILAAFAAGVVGATDEDATALGQELYIERCVLCHGSKGHGWEWPRKVVKPPIPAPNLVETVPEVDDEYLKDVILDGGEAVGLTRFMPAFRFRMSEQEAEAVIKYLRAITGDRRRE